jgi:hypothetical protein
VEDGEVTDVQLPAKVWAELSGLVTEILKPEMLDPPLSDGATHERTDCPFALDVAAKDRGTLGTAPGFPVAVPAVPVPITFIALTVNVNVAPLSNPVKVQLVAVLGRDWQLAGTGGK